MTQGQAPENLDRPGERVERKPTPAEDLRTSASLLMCKEVYPGPGGSKGGSGSDDKDEKGEGDDDDSGVRESKEQKESDEPKEGVAKLSKSDVLEMLRGIGEENSERVLKSLQQYLSQGFDGVLNDSTFNIANPYYKGLPDVMPRTALSLRSDKRMQDTGTSTPSDSPVKSGDQPVAGHGGPAPRMVASVGGRGGDADVSGSVKEVADAVDKAGKKERKFDRTAVDDNVTRKIDPKIDTPEKVRERYSKHLDSLVDQGKLTADERKHMSDAFNRNMDAIAGTKDKPGLYDAKQVSEICRAMNTVLDNSGKGKRLDGVQGANTLCDLAAQGVTSGLANRGEFVKANPFSQGEHNLCASASNNRLLAQRNFVEHANRVGSIAAKGGAFVGGENGTKRSFVSLHEANFKGDKESNRPWNEKNIMTGGQQGYATMLVNALDGQREADIATEMHRKSGQLKGDEKYTYVANNATALGAKPGQSQTGEGTFITNTKDGSHKFVCGSPLATPEVVGRRNHEEGLGNLLVHESFGKGRGGLGDPPPPGITYFRDAAHLKEILGKTPGQERQILTNGTMVAGRAGHGLHAQTVRYEEAGVNKNKLVWGNNWTANHNNVVYQENAGDKTAGTATRGETQLVDNFTNPNKWSGFKPQYTVPDGGKEVPDWKRERIGPDTNTAKVDKDFQKDDKSAKNDKGDAGDDAKRLKPGEQRNDFSRYLADLGQWYSKLSSAQRQGNTSDFLASNPRPDISTYRLS